MKALSYEEYQRLSEGGLSVPVFRELPGDLRTPVSAFLSLASRAERAFLLESVLGGERLARYSFLGRDPVARLEVQDGKIVLQDASGSHEQAAGLMAALRERLGPPPAEVPGPAALHRRRRRLPDLGRGAPLRAAARPPRRGRGDRRGLLLLPLAGGVRPRAAAAGADRARRTRQPRGVRPGAAGARRLRAGPGLGPAAVRDPPRGAAARAAAHRRPALPRRRARRQGAHRAGDIFQVVLSRAARRSTARSTRSTSTARCASSTRRPTCTS